MIAADCLILARQIEKEGNHAELSSLCRRALQENPGDIRNLVDIGICARNLRLYDDADRIFTHILDVDRKSPYGLYELAISYLLRGMHLNALEVMDRFLSIYPSDARGILLAARLLFGIGAQDLGRNRLRQIKDVAFSRESQILDQFGAYLSSLPRQKALYFCQRRQPLALMDAVGMINAAVREGRGFSLIRFGDGEGAYFQMHPEEEYSFRLLYENNRIDRSRVWFNNDDEGLDRKFLETAFGVKNIFDLTDIAGAPYPAWLNEEYNILSIVGVCSLGNIARHLGYSDRVYRICSQQIHIELQTSGALRSILDSVDECGLISCFSEAPARLKKAFGLRDVEFHKLPGEKLFEEKLGKEATAGTHFPDVFDQIMHALSRPLNGKLFLVSGGLLGKLYCAQIKKSGGIALDIGSLVDAWMGVQTRPGFGSHNFRL